MPTRETEANAGVGPAAKQVAEHASSLARLELELAILELKKKGAALGIGSKTVETHLSRVFERFGVSSRAELAARAVREGWLDVPPAG